MARPKAFNVSVHQVDRLNGNRLTLVDNAEGLRAAAIELGLSISQLSRLLRGKSRYGGSNTRLAYEFTKVRRQNMVKLR